MKNLLYLLSVLILTVTISRAQVAFGSKQSNAVGHTTNATSLTYTPTGLSSCNNSVGIVYAGWGNTPSGIAISGVTWAGNSMTAAGSAILTGTSVGEQIFYLVSPSASSPSIVVSLSGGTETDDIWGYAAIFCNVNQTTPVRSGSYTTNSTTSGNPLAVTVPSRPGDMTTSATINEVGSQISSQTLMGSSGGSATGFGTDRGPGASSVIFSWNAGGVATHAAVAGFSIAAINSQPSVVFPKTTIFPKTTVF